MKRNNVFETFITDLLKTHEFSDKLRSVTLKSGSNLRDSVDQLLFESQLEAFFIEQPYSKEENEEMQLKLAKLKSKIYDSMLTTKRTDFAIVEILLVKISEGYRLSKEILVYLNILYKEYK